MTTQTIEINKIEHAVLAKRIWAINNAREALNAAVDLGNEVFALFYTTKNLPVATQFVQLDEKSITVTIPDSASPEVN